MRAGKGFRYLDASGKAVRDAKTLARIRALAVPPAWTDVWICRTPDGHLQATGRDARGRKQHRYHSRWREVRDATKYDRIKDFAHVLPAIRRHVTRDLARSGMDRERVLATVIRLMDITYIRVGNQEYARDNDSYGLTTMKNRHASVNGGTIRFLFRGKSGRSHDISVADPRVARIVRRCQDIPGQELFGYYDEDGAARDVTSGDVNAYLREISGGDFSARDFRTWAGTVLAVAFLSRAPHVHGGRVAAKAVVRAVEEVAERLGNTVAVCRKCYIHPAVLTHFTEALAGDHTKVTGPVRLDNGRRPRASLAPEEKDALRLLLGSNGRRKRAAIAA